MPISAFTWNHTTLHAIRINPSIAYLQLRSAVGKNLEFKRIADHHGLINPGKLKHWQPQKLRAVAL